MAVEQKLETADLLGDGRLLKEVQHPGSGERPNPGEHVSIHYEWLAAETQSSEFEVLDSSRERDERFIFELGAQEVIPAWEHAIASMRIGERASFRVHPDLAFGSAGCGGGAVSAHNGQPDVAMLRCNIELLEAGVSGSSGQGLSTEERLQVAMRAKDAGNAHFKAGELEPAARKYQEGLKALQHDGEEDGQIWQDEVQRETRAKTNLALNLNLAQCELKLCRHIEAFEHAGAALQLDPSSSKAVYRRGLAAMHLGLFDRAKSDLLEAARREPKNGDIRAQLEVCQAKIQESEVKDRNAFGGMFNKVDLYQEKAEQDAASERPAPMRN